jgi:hypothetical protein
MPEDEYDSSVGPVVGMLFQQASVHTIADFLQAQARDLYGCPLPRATHDIVAAKLATIEVPAAP